MEKIPDDRDVARNGSTNDTEKTPPPLDPVEEIYNSKASAPCLYYGGEEGSECKRTGGSCCFEQR